MLTESQMSDIREHLDKAQNPIFFYDNDADGLCSYVLFRKFIDRGKGVVIRSHPNIDVGYTRKIYELNAGVQEFFIDREIISKYKAGQIVRMRNAYNVRIKTIDEYQVTAEYAGDMKIKEVIPWLLDGIDIELMMPDAKKIIGLCDSELLNKKVNDHIYFDRFGFVRIDSIDEKRPCVWFTHS